MRGLLRPFVAVGLMLTAFLVAMPAGASVVHSSGRFGAAVTGCPNSPDPAYPIQPAATIMASTTTPTSGETIEASGAHYCPSESVNITLGGHHITNVQDSSGGSFDPPVTVNYPAGAQVELCGIGASGLSDDQDCLTLTVQGAGSSGGGNHRPSVTGVEIAGMIVLAIALLGGGAVFMTAGRRRSRHAVDSNA